MSVLKSILQHKTYALSIALLCSIIYVFFAYQLEREQFTLLISLYSLLFLSFIGLVQFGRLSFKQLSYIAFSFRALFIFAIPNLSQDFYRFIWDGRLIFEGLNPYLQTPNTIMASGQIPIVEAQVLYKNMGELSAMHFSNYPPLNQLCFYITALFSAKNLLGSVVFLRLLIILADFGTLYFGKRILEHLNLNPKQIFWYILNPFIIIELTGNLHFEGIMVFFLIASLYYLFNNKWLLSAILLACSISIKLIPLLFLPLYFWWFIKSKNKQQINWKTIIVNLTKLTGFYLVVILTLLLSFTPFLSQELISNYSKTIGLWFGNFEFNASFYYLLREIGFWFRGYNEIQIIGKITPILVIIITLLLTFLRKNNKKQTLLISFLLALSFYLFTATTVHPWYLATILILSCFTNYKYVLAWSFTVMLSYYTYSQPDFKESNLLLIVQYGIVYIIFIWEVFVRPKVKSKKE